MTVDLDAYEWLGDLNNAFTVAAKDERRQRDRCGCRLLIDALLRLPLPAVPSQCSHPGYGHPYVDDDAFGSKRPDPLTQTGDISSRIGELANVRWC